MLDKFFLLTWKNCLLQWRRPLHSVISIAVPLIICIILIFIRGSFVPKQHKTVIFPAFSLNREATIFNSSYNVSKLVWSPCANSALERIMENVAEKHNLKPICAKNSKLLQTMLEKSMQNVLVGVDFGDNHILKNRSILPDITITLRFSDELRTLVEKKKSDIENIKTWRTDLLFPELPISGPRNDSTKTGPNPNYFEEGFLSLQYDISTQIILHHLRTYRVNGTTIPTVMMRRFPQNQWFEDDGLIAVRNMIEVSLYVIFIPIIMGAVKDISEEKEKQLRDIMKVMGILDSLHLMSWFCKTFCVLFCAMAMITVFLTAPTNKILYHSNPYLLFAFLIIYAVAIVSYCFLISVFYSKAKTAMFAILVFWFISFVPYILLNDRITDVWTHRLAMLALNSAVCFGFRIIMMLEAAGEGFQLENVFTSPNPTDNLAMSHVISLLIIDILLYFLLAIYLEGLFPSKYEDGRPWYYPFVNRGFANSDDNRRIPESENYEKPPVQTKLLIKIRNLSKIRTDKMPVLEGLSLDVFEGNVTAFVGSNGAGKTAVLLVLSGITRASEGRFTIEGYNDILGRTTRLGPKINLSFCPQQTVLFDELTVREHLYLFGRLKGLTGKDVRLEMNKYLEMLSLHEEEYIRVVKLSRNQKRKLCIALALCGNSNICLLDEPTAGLDPSSRRIVWNAIRSLQRHKSILITTQSIEEAEYLADRIALLSEGKLLCYGSEKFLKRKYGAGYHLLLELKGNGDISRLTEFIENFIPSIKIVEGSGYKVVYLIDVSETGGLSIMLTDLEKNAVEFGVAYYEIYLNTIGEIFMRLQSNDFGRNERLPENFNTDKISNKWLGLHRNEQINNFIYIFFYILVALEKIPRLKGYALKQHQFIALIFKKAILTMRSWFILVISVLLPLLSILLVFLAQESKKLKEPSKLKLSLDFYDRPITLVTSEDIFNINCLHYLNNLREEGASYDFLGSDDMASSILYEANISEIMVRKRFIIGASFSARNVITAWFNNQPYHSAPTSLQYAMNAIFQEKLPYTGFNLRFIHHPLPYTSMPKLEDINTGTVEMASAISFSITIVSAMYAIICMKERISNSKRLQLLSGVDIYLYWLTTYLWDFFTFLIVAVCVTGVLFILHVKGFNSLSVLASLFLLLTLFGLATIPMMYFCSAYFDATISAFAVLALINVLLGPVAFRLYRSFSYTGIGPPAFYESLHWISLIFPHYALTSGVQQLSLIRLQNEICQLMDSDEACKRNIKCCYINEKYLVFGEYGIGKNLIFLSFATLFLIVIHLGIEYRLMRKTKNTINLLQDDTTDFDVLTTKMKVKNGDINPKSHCFVATNLTKLYDKRVVVNQLCFGIKRGECFGLLGRNGAGKSTFIKMITGEVNISYGDAWLRGWSALKETKQVNKQVGYCPQIDALLEDLTGSETLIMHCLLRGITFRDSKLVTYVLSKELGFEDHLKKLVKNYKVGTKRKLSAALAFVGNSPVLLFDEPTTGMDVPSKQKLWQLITHQRNNGKCVILTSQNIVECLNLCTQLTVMVNGTLKCLGSPSYLKHQFSDGYTLTIKMKILDGQADFKEVDIERVINFVQRNFASAFLKEHYQNLLIFFIGNARMNWPSVFEILETEKLTLEIDEYTIARSTFEQIFLQYVKSQSND